MRQANIKIWEALPLDMGDSYTAIVYWWGVHYYGMLQPSSDTPCALTNTNGLTMFREQCIGAKFREVEVGSLLDTNTLCTAALSP